MHKKMHILSKYQSIAINTNAIEQTSIKKTAKNYNTNITKTVDY